MNATAVETITSQPDEPLESKRRILPLSISSLLRWGPFAVIVIGIALSLVLSLAQKWLWMRQLDYLGIFWTLLSVKWEMFGIALFVSILYLWINLRFALRNIDVLQGATFFSKEFPHRDDAYQNTQHQCQPQASYICYRCGHRDPFLPVRA